MPDQLPIGKQNSEGFRVLNLPPSMAKGGAVAIELDLFLIPVFNKLRFLIL